MMLCGKEVDFEGSLGAGGKGIDPNICSMASGKYDGSAGTKSSFISSSCESIRLRFLCLFDSPLCSCSEGGDDAARVCCTGGRCSDHISLRRFHALRIRSPSMSTPIILEGANLCAEEGYASEGPFDRQNYLPMSTVSQPSLHPMSSTRFPLNRSGESKETRGSTASNRLE